MLNKQHWENVGLKSISDIRKILLKIDTKNNVPLLSDLNAISNELEMVESSLKHLQSGSGYCRITLDNVLDSISDELVWLDGHGDDEGKPLVALQDVMNLIQKKKVEANNIVIGDKNERSTKNQRSS
jgi:hypothetical protein